MGKQIHTLTLTKDNNQIKFGFRIIGGKDEGQTFKVEKVLFGYPAHYGGLKVHDFLISVNGQEVFEMNHDQVVKLINNSGSTLNLSVERGDFIVPNFEEIWPSGKKKEQAKKGPMSRDYIMSACERGIPGERNKMFTTVGKPAITVNQYDNPIDCYSEDTIDEMTNSSTWKKTDDQVKEIKSDPSKFNPAKSQVLAVIVDVEGPNSLQR